MPVALVHFDVYLCVHETLCSLAFEIFEWNILLAQMLREIVGNPL